MVKRLMCFLLGHRWTAWDGPTWVNMRYCGRCMVTQDRYETTEAVMNSDYMNLKLRMDAIRSVLTDMTLSDTQRINRIHGIEASMYDGETLRANQLPDHLLRSLSDDGSWARADAINLVCKDTNNGK